MFPLNILGPKFRSNVCKDKMEEIKEFLQDSTLSKHEDIFEEIGYDSLDHLFVMGPSDLLDLDLQ